MPTATLFKVAACIGIWAGIFWITSHFAPLSMLLGVIPAMACSVLVLVARKGDLYAIVNAYVCGLSFGGIFFMFGTTSRAHSEAERLLNGFWAAVGGIIARLTRPR